MKATHPTPQASQVNAWHARYVVNGSILSPIALVPGEPAWAEFTADLGDESRWRFIAIYATLLAADLKMCGSYPLLVSLPAARLYGLTLTYGPAVMLTMLRSDFTADQIARFIGGEDRAADGHLGELLAQPGWKVHHYPPWACANLGLFQENVTRELQMIQNQK